MAITRDTQMAGRVEDREIPAELVTDGVIQYALYPDAGVEDRSIPKWAILRIDKTLPNNHKFKWAGGTKSKIFAADDLTVLTFLNIV